MKRPESVLWREVIDELAQGLQIAIGLAGDVRVNARTTADDAAALEAAIARAVTVLKRLQPTTTTSARKRGKR